MKDCKIPKAKLKIRGAVILILIGALGTTPKRLGKRNGIVGNQGTNRDHPNYNIVEISGGSGRVVIVIVVGNGYGETSSNPGRVS